MKIYICNMFNIIQNNKHAIKILIYLKFKLHNIVLAKTKIRKQRFRFM